jgi:hypothetical protein
VIIPPQSLGQEAMVSPFLHMPSPHQPIIGMGVEMGVHSPFDFIPTPAFLA